MIRHINHDKTYKNLKGLNIAILCLSSLSTLICLFAIGYIIIAFYALHHTEIAQGISENMNTLFGASIDNENLLIGSLTYNIIDLFNMGLTIILSFTVFNLLASIYNLTISIITLNYSVNKKLHKNSFLINVLGAIFSFLTLSAARTILIIINCFMINKIKN